MILNYGRKLCVPSKGPCAKRESSKSVFILFSLKFYVCSAAAAVTDSRRRAKLLPDIVDVKPKTTYLPRLKREFRWDRIEELKYIHFSFDARAFPILNGENLQKDGIPPHCCWVLLECVPN